jgi:hypothetical protein
MAMAVGDLIHQTEGEGFEPPGPLRGRLLSRQLQSTGLCHPSMPDPWKRNRRADVNRLAPASTASTLESRP